MDASVSGTARGGPAGVVGFDDVYRGEPLEPLIVTSDREVSGRGRGAGVAQGRRGSRIGVYVWRVVQLAGLLPWRASGVACCRTPLELLE